MSTAEIEKRLVLVEQEIAHLKAARRGASTRHPIDALEGVHGTFRDEKAFREAARLGRQWRKSNSGGPRKSKGKPK
jgi:hypothetical protein